MGFKHFQHRLFIHEFILLIYFALESLSAYAGRRACYYSFINAPVNRGPLGVFALHKTSKLINTVSLINFKVSAMQFNY